MRKLSLALLIAAGAAFGQVPTVPNSDFPTFRTNLNTSLQKAANITTNYSNPSWITSLAFAKITGVPTFAPTGGTAGQVLTKIDGTNYNSSWQTPSAGSSITLKVNGTDNGSQSLLNLKNGTNVTIADEGSGGVTINGAATPTTATTQANGDDTTKFATDEFVNNQLCSIAAFGPAADGTTDDSAVFTAAASTCTTSIMLTPGKSYAIGTNLTLAPSIFFVGATSTGAFVIKTGVTLTLNGTLIAPLNAKLFSYQGTGVVKIGPGTPVITPEMWGAVGDGSTDDITPILAALAAITDSPKELHFLNKNYAISAAIVVPSYVTISGSGMRGVDLSSSATVRPNTLITSTSASATIISLSGSASNCGTASVAFVTIRDLSITRSTTATGTAKGISISNGCWNTVKNVESFNSISNFYVTLSGNTLLERTQAYWTASSGSNRYGYDIDGLNFSMRVKYGIVACNGSNIKGMYVHGGSNADLFVDDFETAVCDYGVWLDGAGTTQSDIHFVSTVMDQCAITGFYIKDIQNGINGAVAINGAYVHATTSGGTKFGIDIVGDSHNIMISQLQLRNFGLGIRVATTSGQVTVSNSVFQGCATCISLLGSENIINGNTFNSATAVASTTYISTGASTVANSISNNLFRGYATTAVSLNASSTLNIVYPNICDATNITTCTSNSGSGNDFGQQSRATDGVAAPSLNVASCSGAALGTGSTNSAGTITGITATGTCSIVITFGTVIATNGWVCMANNRTTTANSFVQTASSTTTATLTGTTVSGDVLGYRCGWN